MQQSKAYQMMLKLIGPIFSDETREVKVFQNKKR